jgi:hypothetical protein
MLMEATTFSGWLAGAGVREDRLTPAQHALLTGAFQFRQRCGTDYYSTRSLSHFLVHCRSGLKLAQIARLLGINRWTASSHQGLSSKEVVQGAHHRAAGRSHGKLLPRYAGPVAQFLVENRQATRYDLLAFIERTWGVSVSRVALNHFLKRYGLDDGSRVVPVAGGDAAAADRPGPLATAPVHEPSAAVSVVTAGAAPAAGVPVPRPPEEFFCPHPLRGRSPPLAACARLADGRGGPLRRRLRLPAARAADQRVRPGGRPEADLPPRPDAGRGLCRPDGRRGLPVAATGRGLAAAPAPV